jgi:hypothetical protein
MNFVEGTRFTPAKHAAQQSPYKHLLKPKAGGLALALHVLGDRFDSLLDVTDRVSRRRADVLALPAEHLQLHLDLLAGIGDDAMALTWTDLEGYREGRIAAASRSISRRWSATVHCASPPWAWTAAPPVPAANGHHAVAAVEDAGPGRLRADHRPDLRALALCADQRTCFPVRNIGARAVACTRRMPATRT